jgi:pimeloyl-ACP methyl ester carboxylesterase
MPTVDVGAAELAVTDRGEGAAIVLVHGMAMTAADWGRTDDLGERVITYDRRGYGASTAPEPYSRTTVNEQAEDLATIVAALDIAPALLVGADFGALVVLDVLLRHAGAARAAVLVDPPLYAFVPEATERLSAERLALEDALRDGGPEEAVTRWLGPDADPDRVEHARAAPLAFFADYGGLATLPLSRGDLRSVSVPLAVVAGAELRGAAEALLRLVPGAVEFPDWRVAVRSLSEEVAG